MKTLPSDHSLLRALVPFTLLLLLMAAGSSATQILRYHEQNGEESSTYLWRVELGRDTVTVIQDHGYAQYSSVCAPDGVTLSWHAVRYPDTDLRAERSGDRLHLRGRLAGREIDRSQVVGDRPWLQPLPYALQQMLNRNENAVSFWTIRPDTFEIVAMTAERSGSEPVSLHQRSTQLATKVTVRLDGILARLWRADYWFRQADNLFLSYCGTPGPPVVTATRIDLLTPYADNQLEEVASHVEKVW